MEQIAHPHRIAEIRFDQPLRPWDGFGFNYVETCQTPDYDLDPQDYGGFSVLPEERRREVVEMVFGPDGLRPGLVKMFLDPFHQPRPAPLAPAAETLAVDPAAYDHRRGTRSMLPFVRAGWDRLREQGLPLVILTTLYGPPGWMTRQGVWRGRDLDPARRLDLAKYLVAWARHLRRVEGLPLRYLGVHNEGEDWMRWPDDGVTPLGSTHDHNLYWPPAELVSFLPLLRRVLEANGLGEVAIAPGETSNWTRFQHWGYAAALAGDPAALASLGLITSHGFWASYAGQWNADHRSAGTDLLQSLRSELHAWNTSSGWGRSELGLIFEISQSIYAAKVNGLIPWAGIQRPALWKGSDPNPACAFGVHEDGTCEVRREYYYYWQATRAGRPGMAVAPLHVTDTEIYGAAFAPNGSPFPPAFFLANLGKEPKPLSFRLGGAPGTRFQVYRSGPAESAAPHGTADLAAGAVLPPSTVTTFLAVG